MEIYLLNTAVKSQGTLWKRSTSLTQKVRPVIRRVYTKINERNEKLAEGRKRGIAPELRNYTGLMQGYKSGMGGGGGGSSEVINWHCLLTWLVRSQSPFVTCTGKLSWCCTRGYGDCIISTWLHQGSCGLDTLLNLSALIVRACHKSISSADN